MRVSIVVTTLSGRKPTTLDCLKKLEPRLDFELVIVRDVYNASRARNIGIRKAKGKIVALLDDDLMFEPQDLLFLLSRVERGKFVWSNNTAILAFKEDFMCSGGFDESVFRIYHEDTEFEERLAKMGFVIEYHDNIKHLGGEFSWFKLLLLKFNRPFFLLRHKPKSVAHELVRGFLYKHPLRWLLNFAFLLGLAYHTMKLAFGGTNELSIEEEACASSSHGSP